MLSGVNGAKYNDHKRGMKENFVAGTSTYPESPEAVLRILNAYAPPAEWNKHRQETGAANEEGAMFAQTGDGGDNSWKSRQTCHKFREKGHIARECPLNEEKQDQIMHATIEEEAVADEEDTDNGENIFMQKKEGGMVDRNWVLLDSQSTIDQVSNPAMLTNIRKAKIPSKIHCNAGSTCSMLEGNFGSITVKHSPYGIANVLLLNGAKQRHRVTYDSKDCGGVFQVHTNEGIMEFKPSAQGLHYHDVSDASSNIELMLVNTVRENFEGYSRHEVEKAKEAQRIQGMIANPTEREFAGMVCKQLLTNCPVTVRDIDNANQIFGPDLANLRGEMTRTKPECIRVEYVQIPWDFVQLHKYVTLVVDVMFMNDLPFLVTSSRGLSLVTIEHLPLRAAKRLVQTLERVFKIYATAGFIIQTTMMDMVRTISCVAQKIGGGRCVVIEGWHFRGILPRSTTPLELLPCLLNGNTHLFPSSARVLISIFVRRPGMISCKPHMTIGSRLCILMEFWQIPAEFRQKAPAGTEFDRNSPEQAPECAIILT